MIFLLAWFGFSLLVGAYASSKGRSFAGFTVLSLLISPLLGLIVAALSKGDPKAVEARAVASGDQRKCPFCAELIKVDARVCRYCGRDLPDTPAATVARPPGPTAESTRAAQQYATRMMAYILVGAGVFVGLFYLYFQATR